MKHIPICLVLGICIWVFSPDAGHAHEHGAHVHGAAAMNLALDGPNVDIELETPLDNVLSFEYTPKTAEEKREVQTMAETLRRAEALFLFPAAAGCELKEVSLESEAISEELLSGKDGGDTVNFEGHADLDADFSFVCRNPQAITRIEVALFKYFPRLNEIEVQMVTPAGQKSAELTGRDNILTVTP
ncbi:MAG: DUF2796 domain-containing protein [Deltaproteobacteria bacterium]|jgi:hypothetical protein|nr:DUF2796 domain-containing protein [Deltaproteobacteria bacterium]